MTKLMSALIVAVLIFLGWQFFLYWERVRDANEVEVAQEVALNVSPSSLPGLPYALQSSLEQAMEQGAKGLGAWLRQYGKQVQDPRLAWIQLDYVVLVARDDTAEAKKVFADVRARLTPDSPVYPRMKQLESTYWQ
jgi:hypothetical protein